MVPILGHLMCFINMDDFKSQESSTNVYMNKSNWNSVILDGSISKGELERMMDNSYLLVVSKMTKKNQPSLLIHL